MQGEAYTHRLGGENGTGWMRNGFKCMERDIRTTCKEKMAQDG